MSVLTRTFDRTIVRNLPKALNYYSTDAKTKEDADEFRPLNLRQVRGPTVVRRRLKQPDVLPPRSQQMPVDQDWGSVWPGPRTFHPATVPLPIRQGYVKKAQAAPPGKYGNAELMKIPNFLHLTPPVIKRQCEALKKFCTPWPKALDSDEKCARHFPLEVTSSSYCHSAPTIRNPLARIVTLKVKLSSLSLDDHARDKFLRLVGDKYDEETDTFTVVTDRCPTRKQNYDYAMYLLTAVYHESHIVEPWEELKSDADMEYYDWNKSSSKHSLEKLFGRSAEEIENAEQYISATSALMNDGESEYTVTNYGRAVRELLGLPSTVAV